MSNFTAIKVTELNKSFRLPHEKHNSIKSIIISKFRGLRSYEKQQVLKDITFEVNKGDFFGIVGRNGSGKSTLLKLLSGIYTPDEGVIEVSGKLVPFIELGVGFNPELTGRENIFLNGAMLGFSQDEMQSLFEEIVNFAELEGFMDQKLKNYSSGMQVRLAFSIAIKARSDILIFDEVLAVGDEAFQRKCLDVFEQYKASKQTVILVTHDMETVKSFCNRAVLIDSGKIREIGDPRKVANAYSKLNQLIINEAIDIDNRNHTESKHITANIYNTQKKLVSNFEVGDSLIIDLGWKDLQSHKFESIGVSIFKLSGEHVTGVNSRDKLKGERWKAKGRITLELILNITPGKYRLVVEVFERPGVLVESITSGLQFSINKSVIPWSGLFELPYSWHEKNQ